MGRCIFKPKLTLVDEQLARHHVPRNKYILQAIPVKIRYTNTMAIVQVLILEYMDGIIFRDGVHKVQTGLFDRNLSQQWRLRLRKCT